MENPLVSILVATYNSARWVIETLESAKNQTYRNIELVISDDCSTDNTVELCKEWLIANEQYFIRTVLITVEQNTGIAANANRAIQESQGEWIKFVAGDDALLNSCISDNLLFVFKFPECHILQSNAKKYRDIFDEKYFIENALYNKLFCSNSITALKQFRILCFECPVVAPAIFIKRELLVQVGGFDTSFFIEDYPLWLKITSLGYKIYYLDKPTVKYRLHNSSVMHSFSSCFYNLKLELTLKAIKRTYIYPSISWYDLWFWESDFLYRIKFFVINSLFGNRNTFITRSVSNVLSCLNLYLLKKKILLLLIGLRNND